jgi:hypothetical protein
MEGITPTRLGDIYVRREADIIKVRDRVRRLAREMGFDPPRRSRSRRPSPS